MGSLASLLSARARRALLLVTCIACGALSSCAVFDGGSEPAQPRCGRSFVTGAYWGASAGAVGAWYGVDGPYFYGDWYDPGDGYDPATNSGGITADPNSNDGSGWDQPDDGSQADPNADPGNDPAADTGDTSGTGDSADESLTRLRLEERPPSSPPASSPPASSSSSSSSSRLPAPSHPLADGCFSCTMGCRTEAVPSPTGRQAIGVSDTSADDACTSAVRTLAQWSHETRREKLASCQRMDEGRFGP